MSGLRLSCQCEQAQDTNKDGFLTDNKSISQRHTKFYQHGSYIHKKMVKSFNLIILITSIITYYKCCHDRIHIFLPAFAWNQLCLSLLGGNYKNCLFKRQQSVLASYTSILKYILDLHLLYTSQNIAPKVMKFNMSLQQTNEIHSFPSDTSFP